MVPSNPYRLKPWGYDKEVYKKRNEVEKLFGVSRDFGEYLSDMTSLIPCFFHFLGELIHNNICLKFMSLKITAILRKTSGEW